MDDFLVKTLDVETYYNDRFKDSDYEDDQITKNEYKRFFEGSYQWLGMEKLPKGKYYLKSWAATMSDYRQPGDENKYLDIVDKPLNVTVSPVPGVSQAQP